MVNKDEYYVITMSVSVGSAVSRGRGGVRAHEFSCPEPALVLDVTVN